MEDVKKRRIFASFLDEHEVASRIKVGKDRNALRRRACPPLTLITVADQFQLPNVSCQRFIRLSNAIAILVHMDMDDRRERPEPDDETDTHCHGHDAQHLYQSTHQPGSGGSASRSEGDNGPENHNTCSEQAQHVTRLPKSDQVGNHTEGHTHSSP